MSKEEKNAAFLHLAEGKTVEEAKESLAAAISLILEDRLQDALFVSV